MSADPYMELRELEPGQRFMFAADDLERRGPATLIEKSIGRATIRYDAPAKPLERTFMARDRRGQPVERTIGVQLPTTEPCALSAQVVLAVTSS